MKIKAIFFDMGGVLLPLFPERCMEAYRQLAGFRDIADYLDPCHQHGIFLDIEAASAMAEHLEVTLTARNRLCKLGKCVSYTIVGVRLRFERIKA